MLFVDFRDPFNSVRRVKLYEAIRDMEIPSKLIKSMKMATGFTKAKINSENMLSESLAFNKRELSKIMGYRPPFLLLRYTIPLKTQINKKQY